MFITYDKIAASAYGIINKIPIFKIELKGHGTVAASLHPDRTQKIYNGGPISLPPYLLGRHENPYLKEFVFKDCYVDYVEQVNFGVRDSSTKNRFHNHQGITLFGDEEAYKVLDNLGILYSVSFARHAHPDRVGSLELPKEALAYFLPRDWVSYTDGSISTPAESFSKDSIIKSVEQYLGSLPEGTKFSTNKLYKYKKPEPTKERDPSFRIRSLTENALQILRSPESTGYTTFIFKYI